MTVVLTPTTARGSTTAELSSEERIQKPYTLKELKELESAKDGDKSKMLETKGVVDNKTK
jgi:hypothetical protein